MKHIKKFEEYSTNINVDRIVKCNWCEWFGRESSLIESDDGGEDCPNCGEFDYIMDVDIFDDDFFVYMEQNEPEPNINKEDYTDVEEYYKALYPYYFSTKKYNL